MFPRIMGVFTLNADTFEEIEHDQGATSQAAVIVAIVAFISGLGSGIAAIFNPEAGAGFFGSFLGMIITIFVGWILWSGITYLVGTSLFGGKADMGEMLRVIGFAFAPQLLGIIPLLGTCIGTIWSLAAGFVAVRQGLDITNGQAAITILVGFVVYVILHGLLNVLGVGAVLF